MNDLKNKLVHNAVPTAFDVPNPLAKVENARPPPRKRKIQQMKKVLRN